MTCTYTAGFGDYYTATHDPGNSEVPISGILGVYNFFYNTSAKTMWQCLDPTLGSQVWQQVSQLQSDWSQGSSSSLAFIQNKPSLLARSFSTPTFSSATTATQLSTTRDAEVRYVFNGSMTTLVTSQTITATLRYADNLAMSTNVVTVSTDVLTTGGILSLAVTNGLQVNGIIPAGKYRQVTFSVSGGATAPAALASGQEVLV